MESTQIPDQIFNTLRLLFLLTRCHGGHKSHHCYETSFLPRPKLSNNICAFRVVIQVGVSCVAQWQLIFICHPILAVLYLHTLSYIYCSASNTSCMVSYSTVCKVLQVSVVYWTVTIQGTWNSSFMIPWHQTVWRTLWGHIATWIAQQTHAIRRGTLPFHLLDCDLNSIFSKWHSLAS